MNSDLQSGFERIYQTKEWGDPSPDRMARRRNKVFFSGGGTNEENDMGGQYIALLQSYIDKPDVHRVIEVGCGDWEVSSRLNLSTVQYIGYDVVSSLIQYNQANFASDNISFVCEDVMQGNNITGDLLIIKDVIQHLPPYFSAPFVRSIPANFKYNIVTNDWHPHNPEIGFGGYSGNDFSEPPFSMNYDLLITWNQKFVEAGHKLTLSLK